ncbi:hypothetical protein HDV05_005625 [Chytridiales sp. JEL 0842]|nr:hypothetical protein HDV05_005625 [Chytridiales sp. JEL 0842]
MNLLLACSLLLAATTAINAQVSSGSYDLVGGSRIVATSTDTTGTCARSACAPYHVMDNSATPDEMDFSQWMSTRGSCDAGRTESLTIDWSAKYGTQLISEIKVRHGSLYAENVNLVLYSSIPFNVQNPVAINFENGAKWEMFLFETPVTASGVKITFSGLKSSQPDVPSACQATVAEVQAWTGPAPDAPPPPPSSNRALPLLLGLGIPLLLLAGALTWFFYRRRRVHMLKQRLARELELRRSNEGEFAGTGSGLSGNVSGVEAPKPAAEGGKKKVMQNPRIRNYLESAMSPSVVLGAQRSLFGMQQMARLSSTPRTPAPQSSDAHKPTLEIDAFKRSQEFKRPISPHLTIYQPQLTWYLSALHRITGAAIGGAFYLGAMWYAVAPFSSAAVAASVASAPFILNFLGKLLITAPTAFHSVNGLRHLTWDTGRALELKGVYQTGYAVVGVSALLAIGLALI